MNFLRLTRLSLLGFLVAIAAGSTVDAHELADALAQIRAVGPHGKGNAAAQQAWQQVEAADVSHVIEILEAMNGASPLAKNWLRGAADSIVERSRSASDQLDTRALRQFLFDRQQDGHARQLAYEWITSSEPDAKAQLLAKLLDDPALSLRYDAVQQLIDKAESSEDDTMRRELLERALDHARNVQQVQACTKELAPLGREIDVTNHFGFITKWRLIGPFDNREGKGFDAVYPPEEVIDFDAEYDGKNGNVRWKAAESKEDLGLIDLNKLVAKHKGAILYAAAEFHVPQAQEAQVRYGSFSAAKVWVNGELIDANEVYHSAMDIDQYNSDIKLKKGRNLILIKVCQNEQTEDWAQTWRFQLRVTDKLGAAIWSSQ